MMKKGFFIFIEVIQNYTAQQCTGNTKWGIGKIRKLRYVCELLVCTNIPTF